MVTVFRALYRRPFAVAYWTVACWGTSLAALRRMAQTRNERRARTWVFGSQIGTG